MTVLDTRQRIAGPEPRQHPPANGRRPAVVGLTLVAVGVLWALSLAGVAIDYELVLPIGLVSVGLVLLLGGRPAAHGGLIGLGVVLTVAALAASISAGSLAISAGDRTHTVTDVGDLRSGYALGAGTMTLDLRELELPAGTTVVSAGVGLGELVVRVPPGVAIDGQAGVAMGEIDRFGATSGGIAPSVALDGGPEGDGRVLELDLQVGLGEIEVTR